MASHFPAAFAAAFQPFQRRKAVRQAARSEPGSFSRTRMSRTSERPLDHQLLDLGDRLRRVQVLRAGLGAVHDRVAAVELERIVQIVQPLARRLVARVDDPAIGVQQRRRPQVPLLVPPVATGTRSSSRRTGCTRRARRASCGPRSTASTPAPAPASRSPARASRWRAGRRTCVRSGTRSLTTGMCGSG